VSALAAALLVQRVDAAEYNVTIRYLGFDPPNLTVQAGDVVRWNNAGPIAHTVTSETRSWGSGVLVAGDVFSQQFLTPGTYEYSCGIHQQLRGTIFVQAPPATAVVPAPAQAPPPPPPPPPPATAVPAPPQPAPAPGASALWLTILAPTPAYSMMDDVLWVASPGERYQVIDQSAGWALVVREFDPPDVTVWIELDDRVEVATS
jgi:plastocyanin